VKAYYHARAGEYDDWWLGEGLFVDRDRPGWDEELDELRRVVAELPPARTLDVACGTGFLTRHLRGEVVGFDQSEAMLELAREKIPHATFVQGDALDLPFADGEFDRVFTSYFYCHLEEDERVRFLAEARRVAPELVVVASGRMGPKRRPPAHYEERTLGDGSKWRVFKRYFLPDELLAELGGGEVLLEGERYFLVVRSP
jgi:ubiquinone/menaquinone biosynthesis C-methylase UbiE